MTVKLITDAGPLMGRLHLKQAYAESSNRLCPGGTEVVQVTGGFIELLRMTCGIKSTNCVCLGSSM